MYYRVNVMVCMYIVHFYISNKYILVYMHTYIGVRMYECTCVPKYRPCFLLRSPCTAPQTPCKGRQHSSKAPPHYGQTWNPLVSTNKHSARAYITRGRSANYHIYISVITPSFPTLLKQMFEHPLNYTVWTLSTHAQPVHVWASSVTVPSPKPISHRKGIRTNLGLRLNAD